MEIMGSVINNVSSGYSQINLLPDTSISGKDEINKDNGQPELRNFEEISGLFPGISFIIVGDYNEIKTEYNGISNTAAFSYKNKVSIALHEDVLRNWDKDREDIIEFINSIKDRWSGFVSRIEMPDSENRQGYKYTYVTLKYNKGSGNLSYSQWFADFALEPYSNIKREKQNVFSDKKDLYFKSVILSKQNEMYEKLFNTKRNSRGHLKRKEYIKEYKRQMVYTD